MPAQLALLNRLKAYVRSEAQAQYDAITAQWSQPLSVRVAKGWAIEGVRIVNHQGGRLTLACDTNNSRFREGDLVVLHRGNPQDAEALHLDLQFDGETRLEATLNKGNPLLLSAYPSGWIIDQDILDLSPYYLQALNIVADSLRGRSVILPLLQGTRQSSVDYARYERAVEALTGGGLNPSQVEAIALAYAADLLHLVQGPPGTGKTLTLAHLAKLLIEDGQRVLVTGLTHRSINNALNKIHQVDDLLPVCKIGGRRRAEDIVGGECFESFPESGFGDLAGGYAVGATPFALYSERLANVEFDVVLFDEGSQVTLPLAIMGMLGGDKYIFFGDENQLPPVSVFSAQKALTYSIFNTLAGRADATLLNITYRLNDVLVEWPNQTFYGGRLQPDPGCAVRRLGLSGAHSPWDLVLDPASPAVFLDLCHTNTTVRSRQEADTVVELILALLGHGIPPEEIGVVVPYRAQSRLIRSILRHALEDEATLAAIVVDTVERMQGQEREVVLVSFATSSLAFALQVAEFLFQPQRLNVAVTRPRTKLILVGSRHMLAESASPDPTHAELFDLLQSLVDSCRVITLPQGRLV
jgi:DNA replication ATP-dependent helicase Dna2